MVNSCWFSTVYEIRDFVVSRPLVQITVLAVARSSALGKQVKQYQQSHPKPDDHEAAQLLKWRKPRRSILANMILAAMQKEHTYL